MFKRTTLFPLICLLFISVASGRQYRSGLFLHHSTGATIWGPNGSHTSVPDEIAAYNTAHGYADSSACSLNETEWPVTPWDNEWERWQRIFFNQDTDAVIQPILDTNRIIVIKSCFPSSSMSGEGSSDDTLDPTLKTIYNYKWHWRNFIGVMKSRPQNFFAVWTNAPLVAGATSDQEARLADRFCRWAKDTLAHGLDPLFGPFPRNVYVFDFFHKLAGADGKLPRFYASSSTDSHPNSAATELVAPQFVHELFDAAIAYEPGNASSDTVNGWYFHSAHDVSFDTAYSRLSGEHVQGLSSQAFGFGIHNVGGAPGTDYRGLVWEKDLPVLLATPDTVSIFLRRITSSNNPTVLLEAVHDDTIGLLGSWIGSSSSWERKTAVVAPSPHIPVMFDKIRLRVEIDSYPYACSGEVFADSLTISYAGGSLVGIDMFDLPSAFSIAPAIVNFGTASVGCRSSETVDAARNDHNPFPLTISTVTSTNPVFIVEPGSAILADSAAHIQFHITFAPSDTGVISGLLIFSHDDGITRDTVFVSGYGAGSGTASSIQTVGTGWQMISPSLLPLTCPHILPGSFGFEGKYTPEDTLIAGKGYWKKIGLAPLRFVGTPTARESIHVNSRWNMIGSVSYPIRIGQVRTDPGNHLESGFFGYSESGYEQVDTLLPGHGYWVKLREEGKLYFDTASAAGAVYAAAEKYPSKPLLDTLFFTDATGKIRILYYTESVIDKDLHNRFELPPVPPSGSFDIRFADGTILASKGETAITLSSVVFPLMALSSGGQQDGAELVSDGITMKLGEHDKIRIDNSSGQLRLRISHVAHPALPMNYSLEQNYPNPFNPTTVIGYYLPQASHVHLGIYNILGQEIAVLVDGIEQAGNRTVHWDAGNIASGVYFYRLDATTVNDVAIVFSDLKMVVLLR